MADLRDEHGNRIQLTDELGNPVTLTDERGNPMHLTGIATTHPPDVQEVTITSAMAAGGGGMFPAKPTGGLEEEVQVPGGGTAGIGPEVGLGQGQDVEEPKESLGKLLVREERHHDHDQPLGEVVNRSNSTSGSSSSSEDDGEGGRRKKKGLKEKLKEKLSIGGGKHSSKTGEQAHPDTAPPVEHHEKKSMMEKIKEKLPGGHHNH